MCNYHGLSDASTTVAPLGMMKEATPERIAGAAGLVTRGKRFRLDLPLGQPDPPMYGREPFEHVVFALNNYQWSRDDLLNNFNTQGSSHWDALRHAYNHDDELFEKRPPEDLGIDLVADGIVGRAVVVDVLNGLGLKPDEKVNLSGAEIDKCAEEQGVELRPGDILVLHTGWMAHHMALPKEDRLDADSAMPGLDPVYESIEWLRERKFSAVCADNTAVESMPIDGDGSNMLHQWFASDLGLVIGEFFWLDALVKDCRETGVWDGLFVSAPLRLPAGCASPPNAIVLK